MDDDFAVVTMKAWLGCDCKVIAQPEGRCAVKLSASTHRSNGATIWHDITWFTSDREAAVIDRLRKGALIFVQGDLDEYNDKKGIRASQVSVLRDAVKRVEVPSYVDHDGHAGFHEEYGHHGHAQDGDWGGHEREHASAPRPANQQTQAPRHVPARNRPPQQHQRQEAAVSSSGAGRQSTPQHLGPAPARSTAPRPAHGAVRVQSKVAW